VSNPFDPTSLVNQAEQAVAGLLPGGTQTLDQAATVARVLAFLGGVAVAGVAIWAYRSASGQTDNSRLIAAASKYAPALLA
jgi:hypothetical protein